jgi:hypothetical protein
MLLIGVVAASQAAYRLVLFPALDDDGDAKNDDEEPRPMRLHAP